MFKLSNIFLITIITCSLLSCSKENNNSSKKITKVTPITVHVVKKNSLEITEETTGIVSSTISPTISSEVSGQILSINVRAGNEVKKDTLLAVIDNKNLLLQIKSTKSEVSRLEVIILNQLNLVKRNEELVKSNFISKLNLEKSISELKALEKQLTYAQSQLEKAQLNLNKSQVRSPIEGKIEMPLISKGDFVKIGTPMFKIVSQEKMNVELSFPENIAKKIKPGLKVLLTIPYLNKKIYSRISQIKPSIDSSNNSVKAIVRLQGVKGIISGSTVNGVVTLSTKKKTILIPEQCINLRPKGKIVYIIKDNKAFERVVYTGYKKSGQIEILDGLKINELIAFEGSGFLTNDASVSILK